MKGFMAAASAALFLSSSLYAGQEPAEQEVYVRGCFDISECGNDPDSLEICRLHNFDCSADGKPVEIMLEDRPKDPDLAQLLTALTSKWPSNLISKFVREAGEGSRSEELRNGFFSVYEETDDSPAVDGRKYALKDGRTLFALLFHFAATESFAEEALRFYVYNPGDGSMKLLENYASELGGNPLQTNCFPDVTSYELKPDAVGVYNECVDGSIFDLRLTYAFDGAGLAFSDGVIVVPSDRKKLIEGMNSIAPAYYGFYDIDGDGSGELLLSNADHSREMVIFQGSVADDNIIAVHDGSSSFTFFRGAVATVSRDRGAFADTYVKLKDSVQASTLTMKKSDAGVSYAIDGKPVDEASGKAFVRSLEYNQPRIQWRRLSGVESMGAE